jgi:hypothetical protein
MKWCVSSNVLRRLDSVFWLLAALWCVDSLTPAAAAVLTNTNRPSTTLRLFFIHHSTGENWLNDDYGGLGVALRDNHYFVSDSNYGWGPGAIGDRTDIGHWHNWFRGPQSASYLAAAYAETGQLCPYTRLESAPGGPNRIVLFKSCFPNSNLRGDPNAITPPTGNNPLRGEDAWSEHHTIANAKGIYLDLLQCFAARTETLFVAITAPPVSDSTWSYNARAFNHWLVHDWLSDYVHANVFVFDFYNVLTSNAGSSDQSDVGLGMGNHHRWWQGAVQHKTDGGGNVNAYASAPDDDHPNIVGSRKATAEFVPLLNAAVNAWLAESPQGPVTVRLTSPTNGATFSAPADIALSATISGSGSESVSRIAFFQGDVEVGEDAAQPYDLTWTGVTAGTYLLTARAWDDRGAVVSSAPVTVIVLGGTPASYLVHPADALGTKVPYVTVARPGKGEWVEQPAFNTRYRRVSDVAADGVGNWMAGIMYSRYSPISSGGDYLYLQRTGSEDGRDGMIYAASSGKLHKILPGAIEIDGEPDQSLDSTEGAEFRWDYSGRYPTRLYYRANAAFYAYDLTTDRAHLIHDFGLDYPGAEVLHNDAEGDSSADSRYWAWMVKGAYDEAEGVYPLRAVVTFDKETKRILGRLDLAAYHRLGGHYADMPTPNMVEVSPSGRRAITHYGWCYGERRLGTNWVHHSGQVHRSAVGELDGPIDFVEELDTGKRYRFVENIPTQPGTFYFDGALNLLYVWSSDGALPSSHTIWWEYGVRPRDVGTVFDGAYAWDLDFSHPVKVALGEAHSGWAWSHGGCELFVSQNDRTDWIEAYDIFTGERMQILQHGDFGWGNGWHFARMPASVPGWILMSTYCGANIDWGDNQLMMLEMRDHASTPPPRVWRLGPTHNRWFIDDPSPENYYAEAFAAISPQGDRLWWNARWPGTVQVETYEMALPPNWWTDLGGRPGLAIRSAKADPTGAFEFRWPSARNRTYTVMTTSNLTSAFTVLTNGILAQPPENTWVWSTGGTGQRFFRVREDSP